MGQITDPFQRGGCYINVDSRYKYRENITHVFLHNTTPENKCVTAQVRAPKKLHPTTHYYSVYVIRTPEHVCFASYIQTAICRDLPFGEHRGSGGGSERAMECTSTSEPKHSMCHTFTISTPGGDVVPQGIDYKY